MVSSDTALVHEETCWVIQAIADLGNVFTGMQMDPPFLSTISVLKTELGRSKCSAIYPDYQTAGN